MTGRLRGGASMLWRLAGRGTRHHPGGAALVVVAIAASAFTLTLALAVDDAAESPWDRTFAAAAGPDVVVYADDPAPVATIAGAAEVTEVGGPFPLLRFGDLYLVGRDRTDAPVDRPVVTDGGWIDDGGVVVERSYARARDLTVGDELPLGPRRLEVVGIAVTGGWAAYPGHQPAMAWTTRAQAEALAPWAGDRRVIVSLSLDDPAGAREFARTHGVADAAGPQAVPWDRFRDASTADAHTNRLVLLTGAIALAILTTASAVVLVSGRVSEQRHRVAVLEAIGMPAVLGASVLVVELLVLAVAAVPLGVVAGILAVPFVAANAGDALDVTGRPGVAGTHLALVALVSVATILVAAAPAALRGARRRPGGDPAVPAHAPARSWARLPVTVLIGVRIASRRPARGLLAGAGLGITVGMVVAALTLESTVAAGAMTAESYLLADVRRVAYGFVLALVALAVVNGALLAWSTALETRRTIDLLEVLGATPRQWTAGIVVAQSLPAVVAALAGMPAGIWLLRLLFRLGGGEPAAVVPPPAWWLAAAVVATVLVAMVFDAGAVRWTRRGSRLTADPQLRH